MNFIKRLAIGLMVVMLFGGISNCSRDSRITCGNLEEFLDVCYPACRAKITCELRYDSSSFQTQRLLDLCSDCLSDEAHFASCGTCSVVDHGISYDCFDVMRSHLGATCF